MALPLTPELAMKPKAVGYVRVSSAAQAEQGISLDEQRGAIADYCRAHDLDLLGIEADEGVSGRRRHNRPGLAKALRRVCACRGVLVAVKLDRVGRSVVDLAAIADQIKQAGCGFVLIRDMIDTRSAAGRMFFHMVAAFAEFEADLASERIRNVQNHKRRLGQRISRFAPFGFRFDDDGQRLVPIPAERAIAAEIVERRQSGATYNKLAADLNSRGVPSKRGGTWHAPVVRTVYLREVNKLCPSL